MRPLAPAFSLIEVLVTVAIIALLIAILLPSLRAAREQTRCMACEAKVRQTAVAWHLYLADSNEWFPSRVVNANANYGGKQGRGSALFQVPKPLNKHVSRPLITQEAKAFECPLDSGLSTFQPSCYEYMGTSYNTNNMILGDNKLLALVTDPCNQSPDSLIAQLNARFSSLPKDKEGNQALRLRDLTTNNARLVLIGDFGWWNAYYFTTIQDTGQWHARASCYNLGFLDGHADFIRVRKGLQVTDRYTVVPFKDLLSVAAASQQEVKP